MPTLGSNGDADIEGRLMDTGVGKKERVEIYGKSNMETCIIICKIDSKWEFAV